MVQSKKLDVISNEMFKTNYNSLSTIDKQTVFLMLLVGDYFIFN